MHVIATAGHVDHGKSTLVRALTGSEPDRWAEERRRGLTIDLGYAWTSLPSGEEVAFVDVPGHQRFIANMLAGLGPVPAVMFVVAADEGWRQQSAEHLAAIDALGIRHGILVVTRSDLADPADAMAQAGERLAASSLGQVDVVAVSGTSGAGLDDLRAALVRLTDRLPEPEGNARVRLWVDRAFTIRGSGTVVTGTLGSGRLWVGDQLQLQGAATTGPVDVRIRGLQSLGRAHQGVPAVARVAVNLRGVPVETVHRGSALLTPGAWPAAAVIDARLSPVPGQDAGSLAGQRMLHVGTAAVTGHVRPLGGDAVRLVLQRPLPLQPGDRGVLRDPGRQAVVAGVLVLDVDPPPLARRGAASARGVELARSGERPDLALELAWRGAAHVRDLAAIGIPRSNLAPLPEGTRRHGDWLVTESQWSTWASLLAAAVDAKAVATPLDPQLSTEAARQAVALPDVALLAPLATGCGLAVSQGRVGRPGTRPSLGPAEPGLRALEERLERSPFAAPERPDLEAWHLGPRELAAAERTGRLIRLGDDVVLLPQSPARAMRELAALPQPFTTSEARQALRTTRRVAIPLLEHLDARGWTRRIDAGHREVVR